MVMKLGGRKYRWLAVIEPTVPPFANPVSRDGPAASATLRRLPGGSGATGPLLMMKLFFTGVLVATTAAIVPGYVSPKILKSSHTTVLPLLKGARRSRRAAAR
jgi:hypothetical protein